MSSWGVTCTLSRCLSVQLVRIAVKAKEKTAQAVELVRRESTRAQLLTEADNFTRQIIRSLRRQLAVFKRRYVLAERQKTELRRKLAAAMKDNYNLKRRLSSTVAGRLAIGLDTSAASLDMEL